MYDNDCSVFCLSSGFDNLLTTNVLSVNSSSHQGRWVSGIALLLAAPTIGRTARDAIRYRTPTDIFNFNVEMISLFNFIMQCNVMKSFLEQYSTPDETKIKYKCHLQSLDRNMFSTFFSIKLIISTYVCLIFGKALQISSSPAHLCHWGLTSKKSWTDEAAVTAFGVAEEQTLIKSKVALVTLKISVNICHIVDIVHWKISCDDICDNICDNIPLGPFRVPHWKYLSHCEQWNSKLKNIWVMIIWPLENIYLPLNVVIEKYLLSVIISSSESSTIDYGLRCWWVE